MERNAYRIPAMSGPIIPAREEADWFKDPAFWIFFSPAIEASADEAVTEKKVEVMASSASDK